MVERTVRACVAATIARGEIVPVDGSPSRAEESRESLAVRHVDAVAEASDDGVTAERDGRKTGKPETVCIAGTDASPDVSPDASMPTDGRDRRLEPSDKRHAVVDDAGGVVPDGEVTIGAVNEGPVALERIDAAVATAGAPVRAVTAEAGHPHAEVQGGPERRAGAARERSGDPGQGRVDAPSGATAPLPLRRATTS